MIYALALFASGCGAPLAPSVPKFQSYTLQPNLPATAFIREEFRQAVGVRLEWAFSVEMCRGVSEMISRSCKSRVLGKEKSELLFERESETTRTAKLKQPFRFELDGLEGARDYEMGISLINNDRELTLLLNLEQILSEEKRILAQKMLQKNSLPFPALELSGSKTKMGWDHSVFIWEEPRLEVTGLELY